MILYVSLLFGILVTTAVEHFIPPIVELHGARVIVMPVLLFYAALAYPYPAALGLAFAGGLFYDLVTVPFSEGAVEFSPGWSIVQLGLLCTVMHGMRPLFLRGQWLAHCLVCGLLTAFIPVSQYIFLCIRRESFVYDEAVWWRSLGSGVIAAAIALLVFPVLNLLRGRVPVDTDAGRVTLGRVS